MRRCRFDTLGKSTPAHRAGAPTPCGRWADLPQWRADNQTHPPCGSTPIAHERWVLLHGGQSSISLEYQTYTSAYLFDTLVTGLTEGTHHSALDALGAGLVIPLDVVHEILGTF